MLWLCIALPQLPLEALLTNSRDEDPVVVATFEGNHRWTVCVNEAAECSNIKAEMNYTVALAVCPHVTMLERNIRAEHAALERLAGWAYQFSSTVVLGEISSRLNQARSTVLWLEIGASLRLFGGFRQLIERLERELSHLGYTYRVGIGPTLEGAALLARADIRVATTTMQALHARISRMSIYLLPIPTDVCRQLGAAGVRTIGLLLELPRDSIAKRFGPAISKFIERLMGELADPRSTFQLPPRYDARFEFDRELESTQAMLFPLKRMLYEFSGFLRGLDVGVQHFSLAFHHRDRTETKLRIGLSLPDRDAGRFLSLIREQLERTELPAPTLGLRLTAHQFTFPATLQKDMFSHVLHRNEELAHTVDRLTARLGDERVHALQLVADHRPEASWEVGTLAAHRPILAFPERPLWLLPEPKPLRLAAIPDVISGPERIETGWWDANDVRRDYYVVRASQAETLWVYRDLAKDGEWYLHGFWS